MNSTLYKLHLIRMVHVGCNYNMRVCMHAYMFPYTLDILRSPAETPCGKPGRPGWSRRAFRNWDMSNLRGVKLVRTMCSNNLDNPWTSESLRLKSLQWSSFLTWNLVIGCTSFWRTISLSTWLGWRMWRRWSISWVCSGKNFAHVTQIMLSFLGGMVSHSTWWYQCFIMEMKVVD